VLRYMLDTNICIYVLKRRPPALREKFDAHAQDLCLSSVTLAELLYGAEKSAKPAANLAVIEAFAARLSILPFAEKAAGHYGQIRADLERRGKPIGPDNLMIAGHARSEGLVIVTHNGREFERVEGLRVEDWTASG